MDRGWEVCFVTAHVLVVASWIETSRCIYIECMVHDVALDAKWEVQGARCMMLTMQTFFYLLVRLILSLSDHSINIECSEWGVFGISSMNHRTSSDMGMTLLPWNC